MPNERSELIRSGVYYNIGSRGRSRIIEEIEDRELSNTELAEILQEEQIDVHELIRVGARVSGSRIVALQSHIQRIRAERRINREQEIPNSITNEWIAVANTQERPVIQEDNSFMLFNDDGDSDYDDDYNYSDDDNDNYCEESPQWNNISSKQFPTIELLKWDSADLRERVVDNYFKNLEYRLRWIFYRQEREGFSRNGRWGVTSFNRQDFSDKIIKSGKTHQLDNEISKFYDWNIGATDFTLRLESLEINNINCLRCHFIYKPNKLEIGYQDRVWDGQYYRDINIQWAEVK